MKPLAPLTHRSEFWCNTCQMKEPMDHANTKSHLKEVHGLDGNVTGRKKLICAIDGGQGAYSNTFEWTLPNNIKITELSTGSREKSTKASTKGKP